MIRYCVYTYLTKAVKFKDSILNNSFFQFFDEIMQFYSNPVLKLRSFTQGRKVNAINLMTFK